MRLKPSQFELFLERLLVRIGDHEFIFCREGLTFSDQFHADHPPHFVIVRRSTIDDISVIAIALGNWSGTSLIATCHTLTGDESEEFVASILLGGQRVSPYAPELAQFIQQFEKELAEYSESKSLNKLYIE